MRTILNCLLLSLKLKPFLKVHVEPLRRKTETRLTLKTDPLILRWQTILCKTEAVKQRCKKNADCFHDQDLTRALTATGREWHETIKELGIDHLTLAIQETPGIEDIRVFPDFRIVMN